MATYIKDLKEDNGDITRPVTEAGAVLLSGGGDLETTLAAKADQTVVNGKIDIGDVQSTDIVSNAVTTAKIANGAVTTAKIDDDAVTTGKVGWSSLPVGHGGNTPNLNVNYSSFEIGSYTVPENGVYFMSADGYINVAGQKDRSIAIRKNGTDLKKNMTYIGSRHTLSVTYTASLAAGDVISFYLLANSADFTPQLTPSFSIFKVGE